MTWRPYDRTPKGNIPKTVAFEAQNDIEALFVAQFIHFWRGSYDPRADYQDAVSEGIENFSEEDIPLTVKDISAYINKHLDPSDSFIFYVKNLDTGEYVYENDYCSVQEWQKSLEEEEHEQRNNELDFTELPVAGLLGIQHEVSDELVNSVLSEYELDADLEAKYVYDKEAFGSNHKVAISAKSQKMSQDDFYAFWITFSHALMEKDPTLFTEAAVRSAKGFTYPKLNRTKK